MKKVCKRFIERCREAWWRLTWKPMNEGDWQDNW